MSNETNYRSKYEQLKSQFMASVDTAFRLGYEQGAQEAQMENVQAQQQQAAAEASAQQAGQDAQPGQQDSPAESKESVPEGMQESENPEGSELDQHIATLEGMLGKSELTGEDLQKALKEVKSFKEKITIRKNDKAIKGIAKALKPVFAISKKANINLNDTAKNALLMQEKIVSDVMKSWETQEAKASKDIFSVLAVESLTKKE